MSQDQMGFDERDQVLVQVVNINAHDYRKK